jgi:hypothetical protein
VQDTFVRRGDDATDAEAFQFPLVPQHQVVQPRRHAERQQAEFRHLPTPEVSILRQELLVRYAPQPPRAVADIQAEGGFVIEGDVV